jgi:hypothetical protein
MSSFISIILPFNNSGFENLTPPVSHTCLKLKNLGIQLQTLWEDHHNSLELRKPSKENASDNLRYVNQFFPSDEIRAKWLNLLQAYVFITKELPKSSEDKWTVIAIREVNFCCKLLNLQSNFMVSSNNKSTIGGFRKLTGLTQDQCETLSYNLEKDKFGQLTLLKWDADVVADFLELLPRRIIPYLFNNSPDAPALDKNCAKLTLNHKRIFYLTHFSYLITKLEKRLTKFNLDLTNLGDTTRSLVIETIRNYKILIIIAKSDFRQFTLMVDGKIESIVAETPEEAQRNLYHPIADIFEKYKEELNRQTALEEEMQRKCWRESQMAIANKREEEKKREVQRKQHKEIEQDISR